MATSGSKTVAATPYLNVKFTWSVTSQSIPNNSSTISWKLQLVSAAGVSVTGSDGRKWSVTINGVTTSGTHSVNIGANQTVTTASGTQTIPHSSDGTKTFSYSFSQAIQVSFSSSGYVGTVTGSSTGKLDDITRIAVLTLPDSTDLGTACAIGVTAASSSYTHTLSYTFVNATGIIVEKSSSTSISWIPPLSLGEQIPNSTTGTVTITCTTFDGTTQIGSIDFTTTLKVPDSVVPTISSLGVTRIDGAVPAAWAMYVQGKSKVTITVNGAAGAYGSTIDSYSITGGGYTGTTNPYTTGFLNTSGSNAFSVTVTDSRGRKSAAKTTSITVQAYAAPAITSAACNRCTSSGALSDNGTYVKGLVVFSSSTCGGKNTITTQTYYKKTTDSAWTNANKTYTSGSAFTFGGGNILGDYAYDIKYVISDAFTSVSVVDQVPTASVIMDFKYGGKGIAVGKFAETDDLFECAYKGQFNSGLKVQTLDEDKNTVANADSLDVIGNALISGNLILGGNDSAVGTIVTSSANSSSVSVSSGTAKNVASVTLSPGVYLIYHGAGFNTNSTGYRRVVLTTSSTAPSSVPRTGVTVGATANANVQVAATQPVVVTKSTTYYLWAIQNSGSAITVYPFIQAIRIV